MGRERLRMKGGLSKLSSIHAKLQNSSRMCSKPSQALKYGKILFYSCTLNIRLSECLGTIEH